MGAWPLVALSIAVAAVTQAAYAQTFEPKAKSAFMVEAVSGTVLMSKDADTAMPPASLTKLMTMEVVFDAIKTGKLSLDDSFLVSENAWRTGGAPSGTSTMFAALKSTIRVEDLIKGVVVQAANDGCIILAEGMAGSEAEFVKLMNTRAQAIGLTGSVFKNSTGQPATGQVVTMRDMVKLAQHLWREYPDFYLLYALPEFTWNKIAQRNRNPLLNAIPGADGLAMGGTPDSGFAIVGSAQNSGKRLIVGLGGLASERERTEEARRVMQWGLSAFDRAPLFEKDAVIGEAQVYGGDAAAVPLKANGAVAVFVSLEDRDKLAARIVYNGPVAAPVKAGTQVGTLKIWVGEVLAQETPLFAAQDVASGSLRQRAGNAIKELAIGWLR